MSVRALETWSVVRIQILQVMAGETLTAFGDVL